LLERLPDDSSGMTLKAAFKTAPPPRGEV